MFTISYLEGLVFDFIKIYLDNYNTYTKYNEIRKDTYKIFYDIKEFERIIKKVYEEPYKGEKAT